MRYSRVCLESVGYCLPSEILTSDQIEQALAPLYQRLRLPEGRLELMTGICARRLWAPDTLPSDISIRSGRLALAAAELDPSLVGALLHGSVCRDQLEPATACRVHAGLGLPAECLVYDVSNACLGLLNGILQVADMIELGHIQAGLVVGTEGGRQLIETTIEWLNGQTSLSRQQIKQAIASLTVGSGSCAVLLVDKSRSRTQNQLIAACTRAHSQFHRLCHNGHDQAMVADSQPLMWTSAEQLMAEGIATGRATFQRFLQVTGWRTDQVDRIVCHQVGSRHQKLMLQALELDPAIDYATFSWLGNTGSVALPISLAIACQQDHIEAGHRLGLLGIGSGINCLMLGCHWRASRVLGGPLEKTVGC